MSWALFFQILILAFVIGLICSVILGILLKDRGEVTINREETLFVVYGALYRAGLSHEQAKDAVTELMNDGILFRERPPKDG